MWLMSVSLEALLYGHILHLNCCTITTSIISSNSARFGGMFLEPSATVDVSILLSNFASSRGTWDPWLGEQCWTSGSGSGLEL